MTDERKTELLKVVNAWLDSASDPGSTDRELLIRKNALVRDQDNRIVGVSFTLEARTAVGQVTLPAGGSPIVAPTVQDVTRVKTT